MSLEGLFQAGKSAAKKYMARKLAKLGKKIAKKLIIKLLPYILIVAAVLIAFLSIYSLFFGAPDDFKKESGQMAIFTTDEHDPEWNLQKDKELQEKYIQLSENGLGESDEYSFGSKKGVPYQESPFEQATTYQISWALIAAADRVIGDPIVGDGSTRKPDPERTYKAIGPRFTWKDTVVIVETKTTTYRTVTDDEGNDTQERVVNVDTQKYKTKLITTVDQYDQTVNIDYRTETVQTGDSDNYTKVTAEVQSSVVSTPRVPDRLVTFLIDHGLIEDDAEFVVELAKVYDPLYVGFPGSGDGNGQGGSYVNGQIPPEFIPIYKAAAKKYGIPWYALAAIHNVETTFSTDPTMVSSVGAVGHLQFMPATWVGWKYEIGGGLVSDSLDITDLNVIKAGGGYGVDANGDGKADPWDIEDAIFSAANYLSKNGYNKNPAAAIRLYNHADWYVDKVLALIELYEKPAPLWASAIHPVDKDKYRVSSLFGYRIHPITNVKTMHSGIDLAAPAGTPVKAPLDGVVTFVGTKSGYGNTIIIDHGGGFQTLYGHLLDSSTLVKNGQQVTAGEQIAGVGSTGKSTGNHLHFEIIENGMKIDPKTYMTF
ncbi:peptidoglycan DD-metalloendopeptidase family protein [Paenibacillus xylanilyticus]|uniref:Peptidoglycan DD-metalloendopeptidase family protein n=1 Tax=Paenibacillus xylanilyticus TaxID=248903 RepID=A0A7Y6ES96_9BACL|nr:peptidoglycan DD-metalloendopeptidase family protein [Paenibacillus xylanilyticus]NUU74692.1 peptidoglycan DD-metalloendopeptidase family protein [Paenibacillus xylanilyticus]